MQNFGLSIDGRVKLLDFPAPGTPGQARHSESKPTTFSRYELDAAPLFLKQVALAALEGGIVNESDLRDWLPRAPLPLHARDWLAGLPGCPSLEAAIRDLQALQLRLSEVGRLRRLALNVGSWVLPLTVFGLVITSKARTDLLGQLEKRQPELMRLYEGWLALRATASGHFPSLVSRRIRDGHEDVGVSDERYPRRHEIPELEALGVLDEQRRLEVARPFEISIAGLCGHLVTNRSVWESQEVQSFIMAGDRERVESIVSIYTNLTQSQLVEALKSRLSRLILIGPPVHPVSQEGDQVRVSAGSGGSPIAGPFLRGMTRELALLELVRIEAAHGENRIALTELTNMLNSIRRIDELRCLARYIAGRFGHVVTNKTIWEAGDARLLFPQGGHEFINRVVAAHADVSSKELAETIQIVAPSLRAVRKELLKRDQAMRERSMPIPPPRPRGARGAVGAESACGAFLDCAHYLSRALMAELADALL
jgi:hypothetical protein